MAKSRAQLPHLYYPADMQQTRIINAHAFGGGGGAPYDPTSIADLFHWIDFTDPSTLYDATSGGSLVAADGLISRTNDKSGSGAHATSTGSARPVRRVAVVNGYDVAEFDGVNGSMGFTLAATASTIIAVYKLITVQTGYRGIYSHGGAMLLSKIPDSAKWGSFSSGDLPANTDADTNWTIKTIVDSNDGTCAFYSDGVADGGGAQNPIAQTPHHIGGQGGQRSHSYIAEILAYSRALSTGELAYLHAGLIGKFL